MIRRHQVGGLICACLSQLGLLATPGELRSTLEVALVTSGRRSSGRTSMPAAHVLPQVAARHEQSLPPHEIHATSAALFFRAMDATDIR
jgi:hypothetical protein